MPTDDDRVFACEQCDSTGITKSSARNIRREIGDDHPGWYCRECGEAVGVVRRESEARGDTRSGLSKRLAEADPGV